MKISASVDRSFIMPKAKANKELKKKLEKLENIGRPDNWHIFVSYDRFPNYDDRSEYCITIQYSNTFDIQDPNLTVFKLYQDLINQTRDTCKAILEQIGGEWTCCSGPLPIVSINQYPVYFPVDQGNNESWYSIETKIEIAEHVDLGSILESDCKNCPHYNECDDADEIEGGCENCPYNDDDEEEDNCENCPYNNDEEDDEEEEIRCVYKESNEEMQEILKERLEGLKDICMRQSCQKGWKLNNDSIREDEIDTRYYWLGVNIIKPISIQAKDEKEAANFIFAYTRATEEYFDQLAEEHNRDPYGSMATILRIPKIDPKYNPNKDACNKEMTIFEAFGKDEDD